MKISWQTFWHALFWIGMTAFFMFIAHGNTKISTQSLLLIFVLYGAVNISLFYVNYLVLIPRFLDRKKYKLYILLVLFTMAAYGLAKYGMAVKLWPYMHPNMKDEMVPKFPSYFISTLFTSLIFIFLSIVLQFTVDWFTNERVQRDLETQRLTAELAFLKSQINPHFLFNSLNSIYSLAYQKSDTTPEAILKLSEIMRYMLYECNDNKVELAKEIQYLQNYIDLQRIRYGQKAYVDLTVNGVVSTQRIAPLLLIPFIENAFKHGVANDSANPIQLIINVSDGNLSFYMQNHKHQNNRDASGGIGLVNVRRRLDLLYPDNYRLEIHDRADTYTCELSLIL